MSGLGERRIEAGAFASVPYVRAGLSLTPLQDVVPVLAQGQHKEADPEVLLQERTCGPVVLRVSPLHPEDRTVSVCETRSPMSDPKPLQVGGRTRLPSGSQSFSIKI